jgi:hypothetical protein
VRRIGLKFVAPASRKNSGEVRLRDAHARLGEEHADPGNPTPENAPTAISRLIRGMIIKNET